MATQTIKLIGPRQRSYAKECNHCGKEFLKDPRNTWAYWQRAKYCCQACAGKAVTARAAANRKPIKEVFEKWFSKNDGCWEWNGARDRDGYGVFTYAGKTYRAHSMALRLDGRPVPKGKYACHKCNNPPCVNPDHLYVGTPTQNAADAMRADRHMRGTRSPHAKLTDQKVRKIRNTDEPPEVLANRYGVSVAAIKFVRAKKTWKHVK